MSKPHVFFGEREYLMWIVIMLVLGLTALGAFAFLLTRFRGFSFVKTLEAKSRLLSWAAALLLLLLLGLFWLRFNVTTLFIVLLHLMAAFLLCGLAAFLIRKLGKIAVPYDVEGAAALLITAVYLSIGWYMGHHVFETDYRFETGKDLKRDYRIVEIADSHFGITQNGETFTREMQRVQALKPDAVVIVGDFVDDDTDRKDMIEACKALGNLDTSFGVFFVYGNHDNGYYKYRNFDSNELRDELEKNGVTILTDESVLLDDSFYLVGRRDRSDHTRAPVADLMAGLDKTKYSIVLDHQPNDYDAEAAAGADLVLSGHTHGGHIFPAGQIGLLMGANDALNGVQRREDTTFVVTSGISGWAIPFKTGTFSEIVVIDLKKS